MLKVGLAEQSVHTRYAPTALVQASYLTAVATRMDSFWVPDHLNSLFPRSIMTPKYVGTARLAPKVDACLEPWTVLGLLAARNRLGRLRLGIGVTDAGRRDSRRRRRRAVHESPSWTSQTVRKVSNEQDR
jgi:phthiodiolone/phenolphthiodiolone dimycocerosates ketoreductase